MAKEQDRYLADFERFKTQGVVTEPSWVSQLRSAALSRFATLGFPTVRQEEWKYTNVAPLAKIPFTLPALGSNGITRDRLGPIMLGEVACAQLVFVNGQYAPALSSLRSLPQGVRVGSLAAVLHAEPQAVELHLARYAGYQDHAFVALNTAFLEDGAFVSVSQGGTLEAPLQLLFISTAPTEHTVSHPRNLILMGPDSQATIVESYIGSENDLYFTNAVTEVVAGEHAMTDHYRLQLESPQAFHMGTLQVHQERSSMVVSHSIAVGGALVRHDINSILDGEGSECTLNGLYMVTGQQHVDHHTRIDHVKAQCTSRELYKGVLDGKSRGVFSGKIVVHKAAQKTDATQTNKTLLLSSDAVIDSKPQLEIFNNDVQCTHGSTIGELDEDALFYLRTRGIGAEAARTLLTYAFVSDVLSRLKIQLLRDQLEAHLFAQIQASCVRERAIR
jgi:Fe-S cluster assembly protein SufD